jgi:hypothetical protein
MDESIAWVDPFIRSVIAALGAMDLGTMQPFDWLEFQPLMAKEFVEKMSGFVQRAKEQGMSVKELAGLWPGMSSLRCQIYFLFNDTKCARVPMKKRLELTQFFFDMLREGVKDDVFGFKSNIVHDKGEIQKLLNEKHLQPATPTIARKLGLIYNSLYNLGAGYYVDFYLDYGVENEGPYDVSDVYGPGHILVIKRVMGMKPVELFPRSKDFIADDIRIYCVYKDVNYKTDLISVHSIYEGDVINGLKFWGLELDGSMVHASELHAIYDEAAQASIDQWQRLKALSFEEQKVKAAEIRCFGMRKLFERVGMDWRPTPEMLAALKGKEFKDNSYWKIPEDKEKALLYWKKLYDPRVDFYPGDGV